MREAVRRGRAKCPVCGDYFRTTKAGAMRWHCGHEYVDQRRQTCKGVGQKPEEATDVKP